MASIQFGNGVAQIRGSINGSVFSRNANGAYVRNRTKGVNRNTPAQQSVRTAFGNASRVWRGMTESQRNSFIGIADQYPYVNRLGSSSIYTGFQLFMKVNGSAAAYGQPAVLNMIPPIQLTALNSWEVNTGKISTTSLTVNAQYILPNGSNEIVVLAGTILVVEATPSYSSGKYAPKNSDYRLISVLDENADMEANNFWLSYVNKFGTPVAGRLFSIRAKTISTETYQTTDYLSASFIWED